MYANLGPACEVVEYNGFAVWGLSNSAQSINTFVTNYDSHHRKRGCEFSLHPNKFAYWLSPGVLRKAQPST